MDEPVCVGNWHAKKVLGSGGFGTVTLWQNEVSGESLAVKKCKWTLVSNLTKKQKERWTSEVEMMKNINNSNIVRFSDIPKDLEGALLKCNPTRLPLLCMEYCSLGNLRDVLIKGKHCCGLPETKIICILNDILNALIYLHDLNITHRDVKPENIVLQTYPDRKIGVIYKLIDLGYAKELNMGTVSFVGTLQYLAPEIFMRENYDYTVDYWSLGIMAFELICGVRPFLPTYDNPMLSFNKVKTKASDVICMQVSYTGDIDFRTELLNENQLNDSLKHLCEDWLKLVLEYDPQKRRLTYDDMNAFQYLKWILSKKIITVFSVCTYEFYSYEVHDSTLFSTLEDWIARDIKCSKVDFYLLPTKKCDSIYAADFHDENHTEAMIYVYKKAMPIVINTIYTKIPHLIKLFITRARTEFKFGTLKRLYAQAIFLILQQEKHLNALKTAINLEHYFLKSAFKKELDFFKNLSNFTRTYLNEIQFYNILYKEVKNRINYLGSSIRDLLAYITKLKSLIDISNILHNRYSGFIMKTQMLSEATTVILNKLESYNFKALYIKAKQCYYEIIANPPRSNLSGKPILLDIISTTLKITDDLLLDDTLQKYIKYMTKCHTEYLDLVTYRTSLQQNIFSIKIDLREVVIKIVSNDRIGAIQGEHCEYPSVSTLIRENMEIRYKFQEFLNTSSMQHNNLLEDLENENLLY